MIPGAEHIPHVCVTPLLGLIPSSKSPFPWLPRDKAPMGSSSHGRAVAKAAGPWLTEPPLKCGRPHASGSWASSETHAQSSQSIAGSQASHCRSSRPAPGNAINPPPGNSAAKPRIALPERGVRCRPFGPAREDSLLLFVEQRVFCPHLTLSGVIFRSTPALAGVVGIICKSTDLQRHCPSTKREEIVVFCLARDICPWARSDKGLLLKLGNSYESPTTS